MNPRESFRKMEQNSRDIDELYLLVEDVRSQQRSQGAVLGELTERTARLEVKVDALETKVDVIEVKVDSLGTKVDQVLELLQR